MRSRRRRNRATWFPILGFENATGQGLSTVDIRLFTVDPTGAPNVLVIPIIPDIDIDPEAGQGTAGGAPIRSLRDMVEGQSCIIERVVGNIQWEMVQAGAGTDEAQRAICCSALAVVPTADGTNGDPAIAATELDPLRADNSSQPWLWRRVWVLGDSRNTTELTTGLPSNNCFGSLAEGSKIDTKGVRRAIRREERLFLIHSVLQPFPGVEQTEAETRVYTDLRVIGRMVKATNRSNFK